MTTQIVPMEYPCVTVTANEKSEFKFAATFHLTSNKCSQIAASDNIDEATSYALDFSTDLEILSYAEETVQLNLVN